MGVKVREKPKGSGTWWLFINHHGRRKSKKIGKDEKLAREAAKKIEAKLTLGDLKINKDDKKPSFREVGDIWLNSYIKLLRRSSTYSRYNHILNRHVYPTLSKIRIDQISRGDIRKLLLKIHSRGYSRSTVCLVRDVINGVLNHAIDDEIIAHNPAAGIIKKLNLARNKGESVDPFTHEEVAVFLEVCREHFRQYYPFFLCAFRTGARLGELLALEWGDIDWRSKFVRVERSYKLKKISPTKNGKSRRVDLSDQLIETLRALMVQRKKEGPAGRQQRNTGRYLLP